MELDEYQRLALRTALPHMQGPDAIIYCWSKLAGEAGEIAELGGKWIRGDFGDWERRYIDELDRLRFIKEAGDVLWYLAALAERLGTTLDVIAQFNIEKLQDRKERGVLQGSGSDR